MRSTNPRRFSLLAVLGLSALTLAPSVFKTDEEQQRHFVSGGVQAGLARSPDRYVAALFETVGTPPCVDLRGKEVCFLEKRIVEPYAAKGIDAKEGDAVRMLGRGTLGGRTLFFAIPAVPELDVFGGTHGSGLVEPEDRQRFRDAVHKAVSSPPSPPTL